MDTAVRRSSRPGAPAALPLPPGRRVRLDDRGTGFVREVAGPAGAPALLLLHGWGASGGLNWFPAFGPLAAHFRVLAPDLRGHARGVRTRGAFHLADCADDCAALLEELDAGPVIAVGYSMGGPVAQLLWRRHRDLVSGMVLCATADRFVRPGRDQAVVASALVAAAGGARVGGLALPGGVRRRIEGLVWPGRPGSMPAWAAAEFSRHDWRLVIEAGRAIGTYDARRWIHEIDVPVAVVVTTEDRLVPPQRQLELAWGIDGATVHPVRDGHFAAGTAGFVPTLLTACRAVATRAGEVLAI